MAERGRQGGKELREEEEKLGMSKDRAGCCGC